MKEQYRNQENQSKNNQNPIKQKIKSSKSTKLIQSSIYQYQNIQLDNQPVLKKQISSKMQQTADRLIPTYKRCLTPMKRSRTRPWNKTIKGQISMIGENGNVQFSKQNQEKILTMNKMIKVKKSLQLFHQKLTLNSIHRNPVDLDFLQNQSSKQKANQFLKIKVIALPKVLLNVIYISKLIYIILYFITYPLSLIFQTVSQSQFLLTLKIIGILLSSLDIIQALKITTGNQYSQNYLVDQMKKQIGRQKATIVMQIIIIIMTISSIALTYYHSFNNAFFLIMSLNINRYFKYQYILQEQFFQATHYQKYWDLIKVLSMNLLICHFLACILISITFINPQQNWMNSMNISSSPWYEQYIWSYYFGTTILLTIGFGDFHAVNYIQGFFIIFISFFACVFFGYNINYIGNLIKSIRQDQQEKYNKLKIFGSLATRTKVPEELRTEIANYIINQSKLNQISNYYHQKKLLHSLPNSLRSQFLKEANKLLFNSLLNLIHLSSNTIQKLSENIEAKIFIPNEVIKKKRSAPNFIILQSGQVGYLAKVKGINLLNNTIIQKLSTKMQKEPSLICLDVLSNEPLNYQIKSLAYSIVYEMNKEKFENSLRNSQEDYQTYREILDKCRYKLGEFSIIKCRYCENKFHTLFQCPKLHYVPFKNVIPLKKNKKKQASKQMRIKFNRVKQFAFSQKSIRNILDNSSHQLTIQQEKSNRFYNNLFQMKGGKILHSNYLESPHSQELKSNNSFHLTMQMVTKIREDIDNLKKETEKTSFKFDLWGNIDCDQLHNYTYYLSKCNSNEVLEKWTGNCHSRMLKSSRKKICKKSN